MRKTAEFASTERFRLVNPETDKVLYESWIPENNTLETKSVCIKKTINNQYYLYLYSIDTEGWRQGSWLEILGIYGNRIFKAYYWNEKIQVSLYTPIHKNDEWYMALQFYDEWYLMTSDDWETVSHTSSSGSSQLTYYRKSFDGINKMAAYEAQFYYRHGIVAYVDGFEIYRDNMNDGAVLPSSKPLKEYDVYNYRGVIRIGSEVIKGSHILAIEIHRLDNDLIDFDCWLALYGSNRDVAYSISCYPVPVKNVTYDDMVSAYSSDFCLNTIEHISYFIPDSSYLLYEIHPAQVMAWEYYPYYPEKAITKMKVQGYKLYSDDLMEAVTKSIEIVPNEISLTTTGHISSGYSDRYRFYPMELNDLPFTISELIPLVINSISEIEILLIFNTFYALTVNEESRINPAKWSIFTCVSEPELPEGLKFNNCSIVGIPTVLQPNTTYHIYSYNYQGTRRHTVVIAIVEKEVEKEVKSTWYLWIIVGVIVIASLVIGFGIFFYSRCKTDKVTLPILHLDHPSFPVPSYVISPQLTQSELSSLQPTESLSSQDINSIPVSIIPIFPPTEPPSIQHNPAKVSVLAPSMKPEPSIVPVLSQPTKPEPSVVSVLSKPSHSSISPVLPRIVTLDNGLVIDINTLPQNKRPEILAKNDL